jgi:hypothetical protein
MYPCAVRKTKTGSLVNTDGKFLVDNEGTRSIFIVLSQTISEHDRLSCLT